jgi:hypothetical protein
VIVDVDAHLEVARELMAADRQRFRRRSIDRFIGMRREPGSRLKRTRVQIIGQLADRSIDLPSVPRAIVRS